MTKAEKTSLNKKEAKVAKAFDVSSAERFRLLRRLLWASHLEALINDGGDNPFLARRKPFCLCYLCFLLFKNLFAYFCLDVFFCSDRKPMKVAVL